MGKIFMVSCLILMFFIGHQCGVESVDIPKYNSTVITVHDTVWGDTVNVITLDRVIIHDTIYKEFKYEGIIDSTSVKDIFKVRTYKQVYRNEEVETTVYDSILGKKLNQRVNYRLFKPLSISNSTITSVTPIDTIKIAKNKEIRLGGDISPKNIFINLDYQSKKNTYGIAYDPFNKIPGTNIGYIRVKYAYSIVSW